MTGDSTHIRLKTEIYPTISDEIGLISLIRAMAARMAAARGLAPAPSPHPVLDTLDWHSVDVRLLGDVYGDLMSGRHSQGSYYTPKAIADQVVAWTLLDQPSRVLDPAMGAGHFL